MAVRHVERHVLAADPHGFAPTNTQGLRALPPHPRRVGGGRRTTQAVEHARDHRLLVPELDARADHDEEAREPPLVLLLRILVALLGRCLPETSARSKLRPPGFNREARVTVALSKEGRLAHDVGFPIEGCIAEAVRNHRLGLQSILLMFCYVGPIFWFAI